MIMKLKKDNFTKWLFLKGLRIKNYNFDLIYDIHRIQEDNQKFRNNTEKPYYKIYTIFFRDLGSHLWTEDDEKDIYNMLLINNETAYQLKFCFNNDYFSNIPFVEIKKIK